MGAVPLEVLGAQFRPVRVVAFQHLARQERVIGLHARIDNRDDDALACEPPAPRFRCPDDPRTILEAVVKRLRIGEETVLGVVLQNRHACYLDVLNRQRKSGEVRLRIFDAFFVAQRTHGIG